MIKLTDEMRRLINQARANETPCMMATSSPDGVPNAGFRGTMIVLDEESLAYRERGQLSAVRPLEENPKVVVLYWNQGRNVGWKFRCTAAIHRDGPPAETTKVAACLQCGRMSAINRVKGELWQTRYAWASSEPISIGVGLSDRICQP